MIGWRYLPEVNLYEFVPYQHKEGKRIIHFNGIVQLKKGDTLPFAIRFDDSFWYVMLNYQGDVYVYPHASTKKKAYRIVHWFGGNQAAPNNIKIKFQWN